MLSLFSGSRGPDGPDLPSPCGRKFHISCFTVCLYRSKGDLNFLKIQTNDDFYNELLHASKKFRFEYEVRNEEQQKNELIFYNPRILDSDGNPYKPMRDLTRVGIFLVRDLIFKKGQKNYSGNVFLKIKEINVV